MRLLSRKWTVRSAIQNLRSDTHAWEVIRGTATTLLVRVFGSGLAFLFNVLIARRLGPSGAGQYFLAYTALTIVTVIGQLGLNFSVLRFTATAAAMENWAQVRGLYRSAMQYAAVASLLVTAALILVRHPLARLLAGGEVLPKAFAVIAVGTLPYVFFTLHGEMLKGLRRIFQSQLVQSFWVPALAIPALLVLPRTSTAACAAYVFGASGAAVAGWLNWRQASGSWPRRTEAFPRQRLLGSCLPLLAVTALDLAGGWIATLTLGHWGTAADVGIFGAAWRTAMLVSLLLVAVNSIAAPKFAAFYELGELEELARMARRSAQYTTILASPILLVFVAMPGQVMKLFGTKFQGGGFVLTLLALAQLANVAAGSVGHLLMMTGHERQVRDSNIISTALVLLLCVALVPAHGALGAAISVSIALGVRNLLEILLVRRYLGMWIVPFVPMAVASPKIQERVETAIGF